MTPHFKDRDEYERWKAEKRRETAESKEREPDKKVADPGVLAQPEPKQSAADLFREDLRISEPNESTMDSSKLIKCEDCGKDVSKRADKCPHCGAPIQIQKSESLGQAARAPTTETVLPLSKMDQSQIIRPEKVATAIKLLKESNMRWTRWTLVVIPIILCEVVFLGLFGLWLLGFIGGYTGGGLINILLILAIVALISVIAKKSYVFLMRLPS
jgi:DNA-directed RNA polymerase subunit RPC12/RpoP